MTEARTLWTFLYMAVCLRSVNQSENDNLSVYRRWKLPGHSTLKQSVETFASVSHPDNINK